MSENTQKNFEVTSDEFNFVVAALREISGNRRAMSNQHNAEADAIDKFIGMITGATARPIEPEPLTGEQTVAETPATEAVQKKRRGRPPKAQPQANGSSEDAAATV